MDRTDSLIEQFRALPAESDEKRELIAAMGDVLADRPDHPAAVPFLASVTADSEEYDLARVEATTVLRLRPPAEAESRLHAGRALVAVVRGPDDDLVRQYAAMALGPYADDPEVHEVLAAAIMDDFDRLVRDNALAALDEAGPSDKRIELLHRLSADTTLGHEAVRILSSWGLEPAA
ncbi:HEAT repeat domain-containing protein [Streptomyces sp. NBC_01799]|uniref:HEAT repeat domain-containing protein n=1 Tax=unclassified Streptomyces TaxID=2593676 RepID=UPI002DDC2B4C|nr:HEAT repeat domain-containing protein [Streptomyces sp. NBC_01800]WSA68962.1 HEAT repeat domain-containing protein [Streptomyces sp. NBC_01800]WSA77457.1 HEAT repeat domain-containing protein [Streptomyces sp. NBC_01799]